MESEDLKILLALEGKWTVSLNGREFLALRSSEISVEESTIRFGKYSRRILDLDWLRPNVFRMRTRARAGRQIDTVIFYPGDHLPSIADLRRRRRAFQADIGRALCEYFGTRKIQRQTLYSDRRHGIGGAYPRFLVGKHAIIAAAPDESSAVVNGIMRAALLWAPLVRRPVVAILPQGRHQTISARLHVMPDTRGTIEWLQWDGDRIKPLDDENAAPETDVHEFVLPDVSSEAARICAIAPELLHALPHIAGRALSIRLRGIEVARLSREGTIYPLGEPIEQVVKEITEARQAGSRHPLAHAYEERWLESNLIGAMRQLIPSIDGRHIYPQVPSFVGEERNIIDLLTVSTDGRLVVIEIKASADPDLPFQALDYWIAVERHRKAGDFSRKGYFTGCALKDVPALLVLVAPLLGYHKTAGALIAALPAEIPLLEIGINQGWKKEIKVLRRKGMVS
ncbi:MAG TPA: hypothetical protein VER98_10085 [Terriglobia bacterium]|nr:hypothetical protein [Terriglobia bacterium]